MIFAALPSELRLADAAALTVVVDGLGHALPSLVQHALVQVYDLDLDFPVTVLLPSTVKQPKSDIACTSCHVQTPERRCRCR